MKELVIAAGAVGALALFEAEARRTGAVAGVAIPAYVTAAHKAAIAELDRRGVVATVATASNLVNHRLNVAAGPVNATQLPSASKLTELAESLLAACFAGVRLAPHEEAYQITKHRDTTIAAAGGVAMQWAMLEGADARNLSELGRAAQQVMAARRGLASGFYSSPEDLRFVRRLLGQLSIEMDNVGFLITGKPEEKTIAEGLGVAWGAVVDFVSTAPFDLAEDAIVGLLKRPALAGALIVGGIIAWKVLV